MIRPNALEQGVREGVGVASGPGCQPSASAPDGSSQSGIPNAERLKLDRRIHNQRKALRDNWEIVEQRQVGSRHFSLLLIRSAANLCDLLGVPKGPPDCPIATYALLYRMKLAAQAIEARAASGIEGEAGDAAERLHPEGESLAPKGDAQCP